MLNSSFADSVANLLNPIATAKTELSQQVEDVKTGAIAYGGITLTLQVVSTVAVCLMAYVAWHNCFGRKGN